jgi:hypothetical protein
VNQNYTTQRKNQMNVKVKCKMKSTQRSPPVYKYDEDKIISDLKDYIDNTYDEHYSQNKFQATEFIMDSGHGEGFCIGNIMKYAQRYGKKNGKDRKDLMKVVHYGIMALCNHDKERLNNPNQLPINQPTNWPKPIKSYDSGYN